MNHHHSPTMTLQATHPPSTMTPPPSNHSHVYTGPNIDRLRTSLQAYFTWSPDLAMHDPSYPQRLPPAPPELHRFATFTGLGIMWGFSLGALIGSKSAGLQFLAEHAHQLPVTVQGWYFYHKAKNYRMAWGGIKRGLWDAGRLGSVVALFAGVETAVDLALERESPVSGVVAGMTTAGVFALINRLPRASVQRTLLYGSVAGAVVGGAQAAAAWALGQPVKYAPRPSIWGTDEEELAVDVEARAVKESSSASKSRASDIDL